MVSLRKFLAAVCLHYDKDNRTIHIRLALNQNQPLRNARFLAKIEAMTGQKREAKPRGRPRVQGDEPKMAERGQGKLPL